MRFSILVPIYNVRKYLPECLDHITEQSFSDFEAILIDDGSTDGSGEIADQYASEDSRFRVVHKKNQGLFAARRDAIRIARGEYLIFCDADDFLAFNALEMIHHRLSERSVDILLYDAYLYDAEAQTECPELPRKREHRRYFIDGAVQTGIFADQKSIVRTLFLTMKLQPMWIKAVRRECAEPEADYSIYNGIGYGEDMLQSALYFCKASSVGYCGIPLYYYRQSSGMMGRFHEKYYEENRRVHREVSEILRRGRIPECMSDLDAYLGAYLMYVAYGAFHQCSFLKSADIQSVKKVTNDPYFRKMYETVHGSEVWRKISRHERLAVWLMYHKKYTVLQIICRMIRLVKGYKK
ncbi:glycosyltransferase family 2 protein [[Clostridium] aminophilum]|uniref:Glycosyl transferase family 2 n=1 Tax=[Clostridium] aminophilum TaxID=1526 RepID=A0A1I6K760_9FIRM|nr:glycosyltransferase family 2 protein [[Clostridium] aminophilum]SFR86710.1 Glycosyl transferase family 2 [[Clostridium] aminophilum]